MSLLRWIYPSTITASYEGCLLDEIQLIVISQRKGRMFKMLVRFISRRVITLLLVLLITMALSLGAARAQDEKVLVVGSAEFVDSFDPARSYSPTPIMSLQVTYDTLVTFPADSADKFEP